MIFALLQETTSPEPNTLPLKIGCLIGIVIIVAIIIMPRKKMKKVEDEF